MQASSSYGVYEADGAYYLHQTPDGKGVDVFGSGKESPDIVRVRGRATPPHHICLHPRPIDFVPPTGVLNNPLVDIFLPKPQFEQNPKVVVIRSKQMETMFRLGRLAYLGCAVSGHQLQMFRSDYNYGNALEATNLIPLTLIGIATKDTDAATQLVAAAKARYRRVVLMADPFVPLPAEVEDYTSYYDDIPDSFYNIHELDLRLLGSHFFIKHMQQLESKKWKTET